MPGTDRAVRYSRRRLYGLALISALAVAGVANHTLHWGQKAASHATAGQHAATPAISLQDYEVVIDAKPIPGAAELSGITYDFDRDRLLAIGNDGPAEVVALSRSGDVLERYRLEGFDDPEAIAYMGNGRVAITNETLQRLNFVDIPPQSGTIDAKGSPFLALGLNMHRGNKGFEGLAYDVAGDRVFIAKERDPRQLFEVDGVAAALAGRLQLALQDHTDWIDREVSTGDLADVCFDPKTGHLVLLSEESKELVELDADGRFVSSRPLAGRRSGLAHDAPSPEGVTMDAAGNIYIVSEPNLFYMLRKKS
ncbi:SdiA-regulated domain-containing protein [Aromatoleum toluolicum]|uniref:Uncharacterized protein n=1 Tax=Aromatoleum toluolicum TaxID=90060 RepID=A0ABX1NDQ0_9RHOO|nr:SdiA-regulated domain-containing protein [Aromatoleum toluolicum]NMF97422.1 SdiA-regulated domain-containing protein [Aromatoleum toluolicum]